MSLKEINLNQKNDAKNYVCYDGIIENEIPDVGEKMWSVFANLHQISDVAVKDGTRLGKVREMTAQGGHERF